LPEPLQQELQEAVVWQRYAIGQPLLQADRLPEAVQLIEAGLVRLVSHDPVEGAFSLLRLGPGTAVGWASLVRASPCETVLAAEPTLAAAVPARRFLELLAQWPELADHCRRPAPAELAAVLLPWWHAQTQEQPQRRQLLQQLLQHPERVQLASSAGGNERLWLPSGRPGPLGQRWLGFQPSDIQQVHSHDGSHSHGTAAALEPGLDPTIPLAPPLADPQPPEALGLAPNNPGSIRLRRGLHKRNQPRLNPPRFNQQPQSGGLDRTLGCLRMLCQKLGHPLPLEVVRQVLQSEQEQATGISSSDGPPGLLTLGLLLESLGLQARPLRCQAALLHRLEAPALLISQAELLLLEKAGPRGWWLRDGRGQQQHLSLQELRQRWPEGLELLLVRRGLAPADPLEPHQPDPELNHRSDGAGPNQPNAQQRAGKPFDLHWFWQTLRPYRPRLAVLLATGLVSKLLELVFPLAILQIVDVVVLSRNGSLLWPIGLVLGSTAVVMGVLAMLRQLLLADLADRIDTAIGSQVVGHLFKLPLRFFDRRTVGDLASRLHDLQQVREFLTDTAINTLLDLIYLPVLLIVLFALQPVLATVVLLQVPLLILLSGGSNQLGERLLVQRNRAWSRSQSLLVEVLTAIRTVKSQNFATQARWQWLERYRRFTSEDYQLTRLRSLVRESGGAVVNGFKVALFITAAALALQGRTSIGAIFAVYLLSNGVTGPLVNLARLNDQYRNAQAAMDALADVLGQPEEDAVGTATLPLPPIRGAIRFEQVSFAYRLDSRHLLDNLSLEIAPGDFVGLVGLSGSGKSTVVQLLDGLYQPDRGRIFIDGLDIARVQLASLRRQVGFVPQESILFDGTVLDNLRLNSPEAPFEAVVEACRIACAHEFIETLPEGYQTRVGERGGGLSGGQKQRIAIARMLLQEPQLVILDEATSALDADTERRLVHQLRHHVRGRTLLFVTHRLGNLRQADRILVMEEGAVVEDGDWPALIQRGGSFAVLASQQHEQPVTLPANGSAVQHDTDSPDAVSAEEEVS
jgi:ATP-binding cassette subfamily B protein